MKEIFAPMSRPVARKLRALGRELFRRGSTGLNGLDLRLLDAMGDLRGGYFVELGANDGIRQSNTYKLQRRHGWSGLLVEPNPTRYHECVTNRAFARAPAVRWAACVPFEFEQEFVELEYSDLMSVAHGLDVDAEGAVRHANRGEQFLRGDQRRHTFRAPAKTLTALLDEVGAPSTIDLLSLDVEGNELAVLRGLDFAAYDPVWALIEVHDEHVISFMAERGYREHSVLTVEMSYRDILFRRG